MSNVHSAGSPFSMKRVSGIDLELQTRGQGRTVLFLHPGDGIESSEPFLQRLSQHYHVLAPSHPGFGVSSLPGFVTTVDDLAYFYLDLLDDLNLTDVIVVGASFGGWIAAEMAIKSTERISSLALIGSVGAKFRDAYTREITDVFEIPPYELGKFFFRDEDRWDLGYSRMSEDQLLRLARNRESFGLFGWSPTLHSRKLSKRLHRIRVPTLLAWGDADAIVKPEYGREFSRAIPNSTFALIPQAGHYAHVDQAAKVVAAIDQLVTARTH